VAAETVNIYDKAKIRTRRKEEQTRLNNTLAFPYAVNAWGSGILKDESLRGGEGRGEADLSIRSLLIILVTRHQEQFEGGRSRMGGKGEGAMSYLVIGQQKRNRQNAPIWREELRSSNRGKK